MSQHTPGPWRVNDKIAVVEQDKPLGLFVADCRMTDEGRANARLIAAAPDLLAALKMLEEIDDAYGIDLNEQQRDQMHDAIRKAEGARIIADQHGGEK
jgi:hypothetical protein